MTSLTPDALLADEHLYAAAIEQAELAEWSNLHELVALNTEISHAVLCQLKANAGAKRGEIPQPLRIPRPGEKPGSRVNGDGPIVMRAHELATALAQGGVG